MAELKTRENDASVEDFLNSVDNERRRLDGLALKQIFDEVTGINAKMWGDSIVGYGKYHYVSERSTQEGNWPLIGFSPRKQNLTLYIMPNFHDYGDLLAKIGKFKVSKGSCMYINKLADVNIEVLKVLIARCLEDMKRMYTIVSS